MLAGKPVIVTDVGFYQTLADSCVLKVRSEHMAEDLAAHLVHLAQDPDREGSAWAVTQGHGPLRSFR